MNKRPPKQVVGVFALFMLMLAAWFSYGVYGFYQSVLTYNFSTTSGRVISSQVIRLHSSKGSSKSAPDITYKYIYEQKSYEGNKYSSTTARGSSMWARDVVSGYQPGNSINVYVDLDKPYNAVLVKGLQSDDYWMTLLPLAFLVILGIGLKKQYQTTDDLPKA